MKKLIIASFTLATVLVACKGTISSKKLDGTWTLKSGTTTSKSSNGNSSSSSTLSYNGTAFTGTQTSTYNGTTTSSLVTEPMTVTIKFTKSDNTYEMVMTSTSTEKNGGGSYYDDAFASTYMGSYSIVSKTVSTTTQKGIYTINGAAGSEIEKNSQLVFIKKSETSNNTTTFDSYVDDDTNAKITTGFIYNGGINLVSITSVTPAVVTSSTNNTYTSADGSLWEVVKMDKTSLEVKSDDISNMISTSGNTSTTYTSTNSIDWTFNK